MIEEKKIELGLRVRSAPMTVNEKDRTVDVTFATETPVLDRDWNISPRQDGYYNEILSCKPDHIRMERIQAGAPVLDTHNRYSLEAILGVVERCEVSNNRCDATLRFSERAEVEPIYQDVKNGIIRNISCGYRVYAYQQEGVDANGIPNMRAIDWEPSEISFVPVQADPKSGVRSENETKYQSIILTNHRQMTPEEQAALDAANANAAGASSGAGAGATVDVEKERSQAAGAERQRVQDITLAVRTAKLEPAFADKLIADGVSIDKARELVIAKFAEADPHKPAGSVSMQGDEKDKQRADMTSAILNRVNPSMAPTDKLTEGARNYKQLSMLEMCKERMDAHGVSHKGISKDELVTRALTSTDYPILLQDAINKTLTKSYEALPQTWRKIARSWNAVDFKTIHGIKFGANIVLDEVNEHGEYKTGKPAESEEKWALKTYGKIIPITRKTIINDDLNGFARLAEFIGQSVSRKENQIMWGLVTANGLMNDGKALFSTEHKNGKLTSGATVSLETLAAAKLAMRRQTGLDSEPINVSPKYLIVPPELEMLAAQFTSQNYVPYESGKINPFAGWLEPIVEPLLADAYKWYMAADPMQLDILAFTYLEGQAGPYTETRYGFEVDGMQIKVRHDFAGAVLDYRGLYWNCGH